MWNISKLTENNESELGNNSDLSYFLISDKLMDFQVIDNIVINFSQKWLFDNKIKKLNKWNLESIIELSIIEWSINKKEIAAVWYIDWKLNISLKNWEIKIFDLKKQLDKVLLKSILQNTTKEEIEKKVANLNGAIEKIFSNNNIWINWEIEKNDKLIPLETWKFKGLKEIQNKKTIAKFWIDLKDKNLKDLKSLLDVENKKLFAVYDITWETHKKQDLLKQEIKIYTWIWDDYEWGANYFWLSSSEINNKVEKLWSSMSIDEVLSYTRTIKGQMEWNFYRSDMVEQINLKLINILYDYSFKRLKSEKAPNNKFIELIKIMTWRWKLELDKDKNKKYADRQKFDYESKILTFEMSSNFNNTLFANSILIHLMYKEEWWLINEIRDKKDLNIDNKQLDWKKPLISKIKEKVDINIEDKQLDWKSPSQVLEELKSLFNYEWWNKILKILWYNEKLNKPYKDLKFNEKIEIWALARIIKKINEIKSTNKLESNPHGIWDDNHSTIESNSNFFNPRSLDFAELSKQITDETLTDLNESLSDSLDWEWWIFNVWSKSAKDLWLFWAEAEIFELYQGINWNNWIHDFKDESVPWLWTIAFWISLTAWLIILWPALWAMAWTTVFETFLIWLVAWWKMWLAGSAAFQWLSHKWYDTYEEWFIDVCTQVWIDVILSGAFTATWFSTLRYMWVNINPDLLFSWKAWTTKEWLIDKSFIASEVYATMIASWFVSEEIKRLYIEHHTDTDTDNKLNVNKTIDI